MKPGSRIQICLYSGEILDAIVSAIIPDVRGTMIRAKSGDRVVTVKEEQCSHSEALLCNNIEVGMNPRLRLWVRIGAPVILLLLIAAGVAAWLTRYERAYTRLLPGTSKADVLKQFGKPRYIRGCHQSPSWDGATLDKPSTKCAEELWYFSPTSIDQWFVGLDSNGKTVSKGHLSSP
jgi:hypothetical protein